MCYSLKILNKWVPLKLTRVNPATFIYKVIKALYFNSLSNSIGKPMFDNTPKDMNNGNTVRRARCHQLTKVLLKKFFF